MKAPREHTTGSPASSQARKQARTAPPLTASRITAEALQLSATVQPGMVLGVECALEQEPYVVLKATSELYEWRGPDEYTWMGWVRAGDKVIDTIKYEKYGGSDSFWSLTEKRFPIFEEDLRTILTNCKTVAVRQSSRVLTAPTQRSKADKEEINQLEARVMMGLVAEPKKQDRPKRRAV